MTDLVHGDFILCQASLIKRVDSAFAFIQDLPLPAVIVSEGSFGMRFPPIYDVAGNVFVTDAGANTAGRILKWDRHFTLQTAWLSTDIGDGDSGYFASTQTDNPIPGEPSYLPDGSLIIPANSTSLSVSTLGPYLVLADNAGAVTGIQYVPIAGSAGSWSDLQGRANRAGTIFYYTSNATHSPLRRWDILGSSALSDFDDANGAYIGITLFELLDNTIAAQFFYSVASGHARPSFGYLRLLDPSTGSVLNEYQLNHYIPSGVAADWNTLRLLSPDKDDADRFWMLWNHASDDAIHVVQVELSTETILNDYDITAMSFANPPFGSQEFGVRVVHPAVMRVAPDGSTVWDVGT